MKTQQKLFAAAIFLLAKNRQKSRQKKGDPHTRSKNGPQILEISCNMIAGKWQDHHTISMLQPQIVCRSPLVASFSSFSLPLLGGFHQAFYNLTTSIANGANIVANC